MRNLANTVVPAPVEEDALKRAFLQFEDASLRLEKRHQGLVEEVTSLKQQLREKDAEIRRAEQLALLGETGAAIAHEVRNPLGSMKLFVSLLKRELVGNTACQEFLQQLDAGIGAIEGVVSNILQFSRGKELVRGLVNFTPLLRETVDNLCKTYPGVECSLSLEEPQFVIANEQALRQILTNLLQNAVQAIKQKGKILIASHVGEDYLEFAVEDSGLGVKAELMPKLFEPFVSGRTEGTGLGLAIVRKLVEQHQGQVEVGRSSELGGARFVVKIKKQ